MAKKIEVRKHAEVLEWLRKNGFQVSESAGKAVVTKAGCSATLVAEAAGGAPTISARPGITLGGETAALVDKGYQKFLKTSKLEIPASADHLKSLHSFTEELREAMGATSLYNEALGTVSNRYLYDRVKDRDKPEEKRPRRPWEN